MVKLEFDKSLALNQLLGSFSTWNLCIVVPAMLEYGQMASLI